MRCTSARKAALAIALGAACVPLPGAAQDAARGHELYEARCGGCHSVDANRVGPKHRGVLGRQAGGVADFGYSSALKRSAVVWSEESLDRWLADPEKTIPGQAMGYSVADARDRKDLIAFLKSVP
jgi:cytochrome c